MINLYSNSDSTVTKSKISLHNKPENSSITFIKDKQGYFTYLKQNENSSILYTTDSVAGDILDSIILDNGYVLKNLFKLEVKKGYLYLSVLHDNQLIYNSIYCSAKSNKKYYCFDYLSKEIILKDDTNFKGQTISLDTNTKYKIAGKEDFSIYCFCI